jgi:O-phosphoseryl-tRNA(Cys) synthetase
LNGRKLDVTPILEMGTEDLFGPELTQKILVDERNMFTVPPDVENEMMHNNLPAQVHEADDDQAHIVAHMSAARLTGDLQGRFRAHVAAHTMALQGKLQRQMAQQQGAPGVPGGAKPGVPGQPRMGAQVAGPRPGVQNPPGLPGPDQGMGPGRG